LADPEALAGGRYNLPADEVPPGANFQRFDSGGGFEIGFISNPGARSDVATLLDLFVAQFAQLPRKGLLRLFEEYLPADILKERAEHLIQEKSTRDLAERVSQFIVDNSRPIVLHPRAYLDVLSSLLRSPNRGLPSRKPRQGSDHD
jgi:hypothetical protein